MGISVSVFKFYYSYDSEFDKKEVISTAIVLGFIISSVFALICIFNLKPISNFLFQSSSYTEYIRIVLLTFIFSNLAIIPLSLIRAKQKSLLYSLVSLSQLILGLGLNIYFIVFKKMGVAGVLYSSLFSNSVVMIILLTFAIKEVGVNFSLTKAKKMCRYGLPLIPSSLGLFLIHSGDRFFLQRCTDLTELGIYSLAYKFGLIINLLIVGPFSLIWDAKMFEIEKLSEAKLIYSRMYTYLMCVFIFLFYCNDIVD